MLVSQVDAGVHRTPSTADPAPATRPAVAEPSAPVESPSRVAPSAASIPNVDQVREAVARLNKAIQPMTNDLKFTVDDDTGIRVVKVVDTNTKDVIRQIPSDEVLSIAKALDRLQGLIIRQKA